MTTVRLSHLCCSYSAQSSKEKSRNLTSWEKNFCGVNSDIQWCLKPCRFFVLLRRLFFSWIELSENYSRPTKSSTICRNFRLWNHISCHILLSSSRIPSVLVDFWDWGTGLMADCIVLKLDLLKHLSLGDLKALHIETQCFMLMAERTACHAFLRLDSTWFTVAVITFLQMN